MNAYIQMNKGLRNTYLFSYMPIWFSSDNGSNALLGSMSPLNVSIKRFGDKRLTRAVNVIVDIKGQMASLYWN